MVEQWETVDVPTHPIKDGRWVRIREVIKDTLTGEVREQNGESPLRQGEDQPCTFIWEEGNYACDCNRGLFFLRAIGDDDEDDTRTPCGDGRYLVNLVNPATGRVFYREFTEAADMKPVDAMTERELREEVSHYLECQPGTSMMQGFGLFSINPRRPEFIPYHDLPALRAYVQEKREIAVIQATRQQAPDAVQHTPHTLPQPLHPT